MNRLTLIMGEWCLQWADEWTEIECDHGDSHIWLDWHRAGLILIGGPV